MSKPTYLPAVIPDPSSFRHFFSMAYNTSSSFLVPGYPPTIHIILNMISLLATFIGTSISFVMLFSVILRKKIVRDTNLVLCANNYLAVFLLGIFELIHDVNVLRGDFHLGANKSETMACRILAYIQFSLDLGCLPILHLTSKSQWTLSSILKTKNSARFALG